MDNEKTNCTLEEFAVFFLNFIRNQTESFIRGNTSCNTPQATSTTASAIQKQSETQTKPLDIKNTSSPDKLSSPNRINDKILKIPQKLSNTENETENLAEKDTKQHALHKQTTKYQQQSLQKHQETSNLQKSSQNFSPLSNKNSGDNFNSPEHKKFYNRLHFTSTPTSQKNESQHSFNDSFKNECNFSQNRFESPNKSVSPLTIKKCNKSADYSLSNSKTKYNEKGKNSARHTVSLGDFLTLTPSISQKQKRKQAKDSLSLSVDSGHSLEFNDASLNRSAISLVGSNDSKLKPKRRVVPTPVNISASSTLNTFTSPALRNENNILRISKDEIQHDHDSCVIIKEREVLKKELTAIVKEFQEETTSLQKSSSQSFFQEKQTIIKSPHMKASKTAAIDLTQVTNRTILDRFIEIHSILIDLNLTTNILNDISYLLNLLSADDGNDDVANEKKPTIIDSATTTSSLKHKNNNDHDDAFTKEKINSCVINKTNNNEIYAIFKKLSNCIYFALGVLIKQKYLLALLDVTTLRVIMDNERLMNLNENLKEFINKIYLQKIQLESVNSGHEISFRIGCNFTNVSYQEDNDTRNNFPTDKEFRAFIKQRDMFYTILKIWENKHLNHTWNFEYELRSKIQELISHMDHPINMAHLSKLFTSQLIISSNFSESPTESEIASLNVDLNKLTKLRQRLVAPSNFSTDYQFPGNQIFFKEFLMAVDSVNFLEQIKIALIAELMEMNNSSYEIINLQAENDENGDVNRKIEYNEYVVRPETISTMKVLAKFLGLVMSRPFTYDGCKNPIVDNRQIELRNMLQPTFDVMKILKKSFFERKLIITIPWVVQYLFMLDHITLQLNYYQQLIQFLYELYMNLNLNIVNCMRNKCLELKSNINTRSNNVCTYTELLMKMRPTSIFILRLCLGWLFDHHSILSEDYYTYRKDRNIITLELNENNDVHSHQMKAIIKHLNFTTVSNPDHGNNDDVGDADADDYDTFNNENKNIILSSTNNTNMSKKLEIASNTCNNKTKNQLHQNEILTTTQLENIDMQHTSHALEKYQQQQQQIEEENNYLQYSFDPLLEGILNVACPFLADFRVSIMPTKFSKCPSRTGRYRHITTRMSSKSITTETEIQSPTSPPPSSSSNFNNPNQKQQKNIVDSTTHNSDTQTKLIEAFLHSQSLSTRRIIEFVIERTTSAVIKDFQMEVLLPSRDEAMNKVLQINSIILDDVIQQMQSIFTEAHKQSMQKWKIKIPEMIETRVKKSLDGLLPNETIKIVHNTCASLIIEKCKIKTENWKISNLNGLDFYSQDLVNDAKKIYKNNITSVEKTTTTTTTTSSSSSKTTTNLKIDITKGYYPSNIFDQLQNLLYFTTFQSESVTENSVEIFCVDFLKCLQLHELPISIYKLSGLMTITLVQNLIILYDKILTKNLIEKFIDIWLCDKLKDFIRIENDFDKGQQFSHSDNDAEIKDEDCTKKNSKFDNIFDSLITKCFIQTLDNKSSSFDRLCQLLINMINANLVTVDYLNEQFVALLKNDWSDSTLNSISDILSNICKEAYSKGSANNKENDDKSILFMEMLTDFVRDVDEF